MHILYREREVSESFAPAAVMAFDEASHGLSLGCHDFFFFSFLQFTLQSSMLSSTVIAIFQTDRLARARSKSRCRPNVCISQNYLATTLQALATVHPAAQVTT